MRSHFKALLAQNRILRICALGQLCHPKLMEMIGWHGGFDAVWLDQEHVGLTKRRGQRGPSFWTRSCG
jgi:2-keto-3-deoxy-L-rhamnonate aldolase RhmA